MKKRRKWLWYVLTTLVVGGLALYIFRFQIVGYVVNTYASKNKKTVKPNRPVVWNRGPSQTKTDRPNIILILLDDVGYNDLSVYGGGLIKTPHIDKLASQGALFQQAYAGNATCAPSRAMLLTGRYASRNRFHFTPTPDGMVFVVGALQMLGSSNLPMGQMDVVSYMKRPSFDKQGLSGDEVTLAEQLKKRGYHTAHIGKWHLGRGPTMRPRAQGFDESLLMASGLYMKEKDPRVVNAKLHFDPIDRFLWAILDYAVSFNSVDDWFEPKGYLTDYFTQEANKVIEANTNRPFFLYLAHWGVHTPLQALRSDYDAFPHIKPHRARVHAAMIRSIDRSIGAIMKKLDQTGLADNTIVVLSSDNGGAGYIGIPKTNAPFRGFKMTFFEGGLRVPTLIRWPRKIAPNTSISEPITHVDLMPTLIAASGAKLPANRKIDGKNLLPIMTKKASSVQRANDAIYWTSGTYQAVRSKGWKLQVDRRQKKTWLFHLTKDPTEKVNVAAKHPSQVARLKKLLKDYWKNKPAPQYPAAVVAPVAVDKTLVDPFYKKRDELVYWPN